MLAGVSENAVPKWALLDVAKDLRAIAGVLSHPELCGYQAANIRTLEGREATRQSLLDGLEWLRGCIKQDENATVVVFYSGHGFRDTSTQAAEYYLVPYDAKANERSGDPLVSSLLRASDFADAVLALAPRRLLVILDCCHAAGLDVKDLTPRTSNYVSSAIPDGLFAGGEKTLSAGQSGPLDTLSQGYGRAILTSSQAEQVSYLRADGAMSIFTYHLIEALTGHAQPMEGAKEVLTSDLVSHVQRRVRESSLGEGHTTPQEPHSLLTGSFPVALVLGGRGIKKGELAPSPLTIESGRSKNATLRAPLRLVFDSLIERLTCVFAGRQAELASIKDFAQSGQIGHLIVTAPAGFGKSACLASLISQMPETCVYHFFAPSVTGSINEQLFLRNIVEQFAERHGHEAALPADVDELRALYSKYLKSKFPRPVVVVLDGIDEVVRWSLRPFVVAGHPFVLSVRETGQDWPTQLGLPGGTTRFVRLGTFGPDAVRDIFHAAGGAAAQVAGDEALIGEVMRIAAYKEDPRNADPLMIRLIVADFADGRLTQDTLKGQPSGLNAYLNEWWMALRAEAGTAAIQDVIGTLAAALGPLGRKELEAINPKLSEGWGVSFEVDILPPVRRFVVGDAEHGYSLMHDRLRDYLRGKDSGSEKIRLSAFRERLIDFCAGWRESANNYALEHYAGHLAECAQRETYRNALFNLVADADWFRARAKGDPSHAAFLADLRTVWSVASSGDVDAILNKEPATFLGQELRCALTEVSLASRLGGIRSRLLAALVKAEVLTSAQALSIIARQSSPQRRSRSLAAVAPLLSPAQLEIAAVEAQLIEDFSPRVYALSEIAKHVPAVKATLLLAKAHEVAQMIDDPSSRADALVLLIPRLAEAESKSAAIDATKAARSADEDVRVSSLIAVAKVSEPRQRQTLLAEALQHAGTLTDPSDHAEALSALAPLLVPDLAATAIAGARRSIGLVVDLSRKVNLLSDLGEGVGDAERVEIIEEALNVTAQLSGAQRVESQALLLKCVPVEQRETLTKETMVLAAQVAPEADRARSFLAIVEHAPSTYCAMILVKAEEAARLVNDIAQKQSLLVDIALASDDQGQQRLLTEIGRGPLGYLGARESGSEERAFAEVLAEVSCHLPGAEAATVSGQALGYARRAESSFDKARALLALVNCAAAPEKPGLLSEIRALAQTLDNPSEQAGVLVDLVPLVPSDEKDAARCEAIAAVQTVSPSEISISGRIDMEDGVVLSFDTSALRRGQLFARLAHLDSPDKTASLIQGAFDSFEEMNSESQAATIWELAPLLNAEMASMLLARHADPLRDDIVAIFLNRLAELESQEAARIEAQAIWGEHLPDSVVGILAGQQSEEAIVANDAQNAGSDAEKDSTATFTCDFNNLCRLCMSNSNPLGIVSMDKEGINLSAATKNIARAFISERSAEEIRSCLEGFRYFRTGEMWEAARIALIMRLVDLDVAYERQAQSRPAELPEDTLLAYWQSTARNSQDSSIEPAFQAALKIQRASQRAKVLARLLRALPGQQRDQAVSEITAAARTLLTNPGGDRVDDELLRILLALPAPVLLGVWQDALQALAKGQRADMMLRLPPLLTLGKALAPETFWSDAATAILEVQRRWP